MNKSDYGGKHLWKRWDETCTGKSWSRVEARRCIFWHHPIALLSTHSTHPRTSSRLLMIRISFHNAPNAAHIIYRREWRSDFPLGMNAELMLPLTPPFILLTYLSTILILFIIALYIHHRLKQRRTLADRKARFMMEINSLSIQFFNSIHYFPVLSWVVGEL